MGIERFGQYFAGLEDQYVLIGGAACDIWLQRIGLNFRETKDLDIVLLLDKLDDRFLERFWSFIKEGRYETGQHHSGKANLIRFMNPKGHGYPAMIEIFSRTSENFPIPDGHRLTPIPGNKMSSLSAILLDDEYYQLISDNTMRSPGGIPAVSPECLVLLKMFAYLDLSRRKSEGEAIDSRDLKKHKHDVFRMWQALTPESAVHLEPRIKRDVTEFLRVISQEPPNLKSLRLKRMSVDTVIDSLRTIYS